MKLTWQSIRKSIDTHVDHARIGIRTCIESDQNKNVHVLGPWATMRYQKNRVSEQTQNDQVHIKEQSKSITHGKQINQSASQSWNRVCGVPTKARFISVRINLTNSIILELWQFTHSYLCKVERNRRLFENQIGIKNCSTENWIFGVHLKIRILKII